MHNSAQAVMLFDKKFVADSLRNNLNCLYCRREFSVNFHIGLGSQITGNRPILLPCGHNMCENCVQQNWKKLSCPLCTKPIPIPKHLQNDVKFRNVFELNFFLMGILKDLRYYGSPGSCESSVLLNNDDVKRNDKSKYKKPNVKCGECDKTAAVGWCTECNVNFCKCCFDKVHLHSKVLKTHSLIYLDNLHSKKSFLHIKPTVCQKHRKICNRYCSVCQHIYCPNCIKNDHSSHGHITLANKNQKYINDIPSMIESIKQSRECVRKAQREIKSVESQLQDYATQTLDEITLYFWEMHGLLQLEFRKIVDRFNENCTAPQIQMRNAYNELNESQDLLNTMRVRLESFQQSSGQQINLSTIMSNVVEELNNLKCQVKISKIEKNPFIFQKLGNFKQNINDYFSYEYKKPNFSVHLGPIYGDLQRKMFGPLNPTAKVAAISHQYEMFESINENNDEELEAEINSDIEQEKEIIDFGKSPSVSNIGGFLAFIRYVKSPTYFFLQKVDALPELQELSRKFENISTTDLIPENIVVDHIYMGYYKPEKQWYRVVVTKCLPNERFKTFLVDVGANLEFDRKNLRKLNQSYAEMDFAARPASIFNIEPTGESWGQLAIDMLKEITQEKPVRVEILEKSKNDVWKVDLFTTDNGDESISIRDAFLYMGLAREKSGPKLPKMHPVAAITQRLMKGSLHCGDHFPVKITHFENPMEFYIIRSDDEEHKINFQNNLNDFYTKNKGNFQRVIYLASLQMCCAVKLHQCWYRCCVEEADNNGLVHVRLVDEGRIEVVSWNQLYHLDATFRTQKEFAVRCCLHDLEPLQKNNYTWIPKAIEEFKLLTSNPNIWISICQVIRNIYGVILYVHKKNSVINIGTELVRKGFAVSVGPATQPVSSIKKGITQDMRRLLASTIETNFNVTPKTSTKEKIPIKITHVVSPGEFYLYLASLEEGIKYFHMKLQEAQTEENESSLNETMDIEMVAEKEWSLGDQCLVYTTYESSYLTARHKKRTSGIENKPEWFRGTITDVISGNIIIYSVFLRDRGVTVLNIDASKLRAISDKWNCVTNSVQRCHLACLEPTGGTKAWSLSAIDYFINNISAFTALLAQKQGEYDMVLKSSPILLYSMTIEITDPLAPFKPKYSNFNLSLVRSGLAQVMETCPDTLELNSGTIMEIGADEMTLDDWYKQSTNSDFFEEIERCATSKKVENDLSDIPMEVEDSICNNNLLLGEVSTENTWDECIPQTWLQTKCINKTIFTAYPTYVDSNAIIYLHHAKDNTLLHNMRKAMTLAYKDIPEDIDRLYALGQACVVRYHSDKLFYRGVVMAFDDKTEEYEVKFIDYGNTESVKASDMRPFAPYPNQMSFASKFRIDGIRPVNGKRRFPIATLDVMHKCLVDKLVSVRVKLTGTVRKIPFCSIRIGPNDITQMLVDDGRAEYCLSHKKKLTYQQKNCEIFSELYIPTDSEEEIEEDFFQEQSEPDEYVETIDEAFEQINDELLMTIENQYKDQSEPIINSELKQYKKKNKKLMESALDVEKIIFKSSDFHGKIATAADDFEFKEIQKEQCKEDFATSKEKLCLNLLDDIDGDNLIEESFISTYYVESSQHEHEDDDEHDLQSKWFNRIKTLRPTKSENSCDFEDFTPQECSTSLSYIPDIETFKQPILPANIYNFYANVSAVEYPTTLHIFPHLKEFDDRDKRLKLLIHKSAKTTPPLMTFTTNTPCLACYSNDRKWYRAIIRSYNPNELKAIVLFVDYWNIEKVSVGCLKQCPLDVIEFPLRTLKVTLYNIKPSPHMSSRIVSRALKTTINQYDALYVQVQKRSTIKNELPDNSIIEVNLFESNNASQTIYHELMLNKLYIVNK